MCTQFLFNRLCRFIVDQISLIIFYLCTNNPPFLYFFYNFVLIVKVKYFDIMLEPVVNFARRVSPLACVRSAHLYRKHLVDTVPPLVIEKLYFINILFIFFIKNIYLNILSSASSKLRRIKYVSLKDKN